MSSKHRVCCCGNNPAQPCCQYVTMWSTADANESTQVHFTGIGLAQQELIPDSLPEPLLPGTNSPGNLTMMQMLNLNNGFPYFTAQSCPGLASGNTRLEAITNLLANSAPITLDFTRVRNPLDNNSVAKPLHRYQQYLNAIPTEYVNYWNGTAWVVTTWQPTLPYCGYALYGFPSTVETADLVPGSDSTNNTPGFYMYYVSAGRRMIGGVPEKYYAWAEKITSFSPFWWLEPFRYVGDTGPVRWSSGHALKPLTQLQSNNAQLASYTWENEWVFNGARQGFPQTTTTTIGYPLSQASTGAGLPEIVFSLVSDGPGTGCPNGIAFNESATKSASVYRGSCAAYLTRAWYAAQVGIVGLVSSGAGLGLRRISATSSVSRPTDLGGIVVADPIGPGKWVPLAFSQVPQNIVLSVNP